MGERSAETMVAIPKARIWPALVLVALLWGVWQGSSWIELTTFEKFGVRALTTLGVILGFVVWWLLGRRLTRAQRLGTLGAVIVLNVLAERLSDASLHGMFWALMVVPLVLTIWVGAWSFARALRPSAGIPILLGAIALVCGWFMTLRLEGLSGEQAADYRFRWQPTREAQLMARLSSTPKAAPPATLPSTATAALDEWPGFRGANRDGVASAASIDPDWAAHPPRELWRQPVGPGWSSPVIAAGRVFTQEQRGANEAVVCRDAASGQTLWIHEYPARFEESIAGAGPRATPTFADGRLYTLGARGALECLDAATGSVHWSADITAGQVPVPIWGFASSPLIQDGMVIVYAGGARGVVAYRAADGKEAWSVPTGTQCYTSAQAATLGGKQQVLFFSDLELVGLDPRSGSRLWTYPAAARGSPRAIQPRAISPTTLLIASETDLGTALLDLPEQAGSTPMLRWKSRSMKPSFDDFVIDGTSAYGFDGAVFCCMDIATGQRRWREGRYGHGQVILLPRQHLLLVTTEEGDVLLLRADPARSEELGRFHALTGKTWNHPAFARGRLYLRNGQEMACYLLQ